MTRKDTTTKSGQNVDASVDDISRQLKELREDLSALSSSVVALGAATKDTAVAAGAERASALAEHGSELKTQLTNGFDSLRAETEHMVRDKPIGTLAIAAALGLAVGYLTARRG